MSDVKKINQRFFLTLFIFVMLVVLGIASMVFANLYISNTDVQYVIYFAVMIGLIVAAGLFKRNLHV
jgi:hypothetical protein